MRRVSASAVRVVGCRPSTMDSTISGARKAQADQAAYVADGQSLARSEVDELGLMPFERAGGELLFNLLAQRYERRSTIITNQSRLLRMGQGIGDGKLTTALLDRLTHHTHILIT